MSTLMNTQLLKTTIFEDLPDEILLSICHYLSQINILDSLLNLNKRLNQTITSYREKIFFSHLSYQDFVHLLNDHLPNLASNVSYLYINNRSMLNVGQTFEAKFNKIDQQFPLLRQLIFYQIDIETLENLSWRFNTMKYLEQLNIDIGEDRLSSLPVQFDEFLCGKLFSSSNSFINLTLNFDKYQFNLHSINRECFNIRQLTISVKHLNDLLIIFDHLPHIEQLRITIGCSLNYDKNKDLYRYEQLWWKVAYLTKFDLTIREKELISHDTVIPNDIIMKITENIFQLIYFKFTLDISFTSILQNTTTKDVYVEKYLPYANGSLWQQALKRNDNRSIRFEFHIELDGFNTNRIKRPMEPHILFMDKDDDVDFNSLIKTTFSSAYWLQKNLVIHCFSTPSKHVSIYTLPITNSVLSTTVNIIDQEISVKSPLSHVNIRNLILRSNPDSELLNLSITDLFSRFPYLLHLHIDTVLLLPPTIFICTNRLHSLSLYNYPLSSCCQLLDYLPGVISLSISNSSHTILDVDACSKPILSITRLKLSLDSVDENNLIDITEYFPNVNEFHLTIRNTRYRSFVSAQQNEIFEQFLQRFRHLRYIETVLPPKLDSLRTSNLFSLFNLNPMICMKITGNNSIILKIWL